MVKFGLFLLVLALPIAVMAGVAVHSFTASFFLALALLIVGLSLSARRFCQSQ
jgi:hypothetical protein